MPFFEDLGKKVSQTSQDAIKKTKIMAETSKLNSQISGEKRTIADNYSKIGEKYFELYGDNPDENFTPFVAAIKESLQKIEADEEQIKKIKGVGSCPTCGADLKEGALFCPTCGTRLEQPAPTEQTPTAAAAPFCRNCGAPLAEGVKFCSGCGTKAE